MGGQCHSELVKGRSLDDLRSTTFQNAGNAHAADRGTVHDQYGYVFEVAFGHLILWGDFKGDFEPESRSEIFTTDDPDIAPHHGNQTAANGKAKPGSAKPARGGIVGLAKGLKQAFRLFLRQTDAGVFHFKADGNEVAVLSGQRGFKRHMAVLGKFHGVAQQVQQNLAQLVLLLFLSLWV